MWVRPTQPPNDEVQVFYLGNRASTNHVGAVLGKRYELLEVLGCGGTSAVYRALDRRTKAKVAVKVLHAGARETIGAFFQQEGRLTARISSPHLVRARDYGEDRGRLFIVFDVVPGESLASMYYGRAMPWRELCLVVLQVLDPLAALGRLGIVHRDVKPDNVYVARKLGDEPHVTLLDLGFALVPPERRMTISPVPSRMVFGTEGFIAPELLAGCPPEPRNDLYSVGALMYTMLTTQRVPDISACPEEMVIPSPRAFLPTIPRAIDDLVMRSLSDVEARFQSAAEMAAAIRAAMLAVEDVAGSGSIVVPVDPAAGAVVEVAASPSALGVAMPTAGELPSSSCRVTVPTAAELPHSSAGVAATAAESPVGPSAAALPVAPAGDVDPLPAELPAPSAPANATGPIPVVLPAASAAAGDISPISEAPPTGGPSAALSVAPAVSPRSAGVVLGYSARRLAAACVVAGLVGAGSMYTAMVTAPAGAPQVDAPVTACVSGSETERAVVTEVDRVAVGDVDRGAPAEKDDAGGQLETLRGQAAQHAGSGRSATTAAISTRLPSPTGEATPRRPRKEQTFEQAMTRLIPRARECAQKAGIAETPQLVQIGGAAETGQVEWVRVVNMSQEHPFARCIAEAIRRAEPPLRARINSFTFFSAGGSQ